MSLYLQRTILTYFKESSFLSLLSKIKQHKSYADSITKCFETKVIVLSHNQNDCLKHSSLKYKSRVNKS